MRLLTACSVLLLTSVAVCQICTFGKNDPDMFLQKWYSKQLHALGEQCLPPTVRHQKPTYRFLWLRTFHHPISVRLEVESDGSGLITAREANGAGGYKPGKIISDKRSTISKEAVDEFVDQLNRSGYWGEELRREPGADGAEWILEAYDGKRYRMQHLWTPSNGAFHDVCWKLLTLSALPVPKDHIY